MRRALMNTVEYKPVNFVGGAGASLLAESGELYLDFFADSGTSSLGYSSPQREAALKEMLDAGRPLQTPNLYGFDVRDQAAARITAATGMDRVFFCNSGSEAVEAAIKLARKWHRDHGERRVTVWSYKGGFHGRTYGALAASDGPPYHYDGFGPMPGGFQHFESLEDLDASGALHESAAVLISPVYGNNDVYVYEPGWLEDLRQLCDVTGALLIFDEVQTGSGRSGAPTCAQRLGVKPDIIAVAKGMAQGCPMGAMLATESVAGAFTPGTHFSTFGGNPLACTFMLKMLDWIETPENMLRVRENGRTIMEGLEEMGWPKNIRGLGMLLAFDVDKDGIEYGRRCLEQRLLVGMFRKGPGAVKITPPLNLTPSELTAGLERMDAAYRAMS